MTIQEWLVLSDEDAIQNRMVGDPYSMAYPALISYFSTLQVESWDAAVLGLHIVYGWMPTIPKLGSIMRWDEAKRKDLALMLTRAQSGQEPSNKELAILMTFSNNSMIGASKFLHFLKPETFPIWDSRVAKIYLKNSKASGQQVNGIKPWQIYKSTLAEWLNDEAVREKCAELRRLACFLDHVSDLRLVELVLFHRTASKRKPGQS